MASEGLAVMDLAAQVTEFADILEQVVKRLDGIEGALHTIDGTLARIATALEASSD